MFNKYIAQLDRIWNNPEYKNDGFMQTYLNRGYAFPEVEKAELLFIGLNPAGSEVNGSSFSYNLQQAVKDLPKYYGRYDKLAQQIGAGWTYTDLFYFKETNGKMLEQFLTQSLRKQFLIEQLKITQQLIEELNPKVIVVFNAKARMFFGLEGNRTKREGIWMGYKANNIELYEKFGTPVIDSVESDINHGIKHTKTAPIPIFFDSFISYQPKTSIDRLAWHIKYAISQLSKV